MFLFVGIVSMIVGNYELIWGLGFSLSAYGARWIVLGFNVLLVSIFADMYGFCEYRLLAIITLWGSLDLFILVYLL